MPVVRCQNGETYHAIGSVETAMQQSEPLLSRGGRNTLGFAIRLFQHFNTNPSFMAGNDTNDLCQLHCSRVQSHTLLLLVVPLSQTCTMKIRQSRSPIQQDPHKKIP